MVLAGYTVGRRVPLPAPRPGRHARTPTRTRWAQALSQAAADAGIRLTLLDTCYLAGGLAAGGHEPLDPLQVRFGDGDVAPGRRAR